MKLSIKSLKVRDLRIEIPATATVGSLKTRICHGDKHHRLGALEPKHAEEGSLGLVVIPQPETQGKI
ncbi:hypothetical protein AB3S75_033105 [Citrus x aurantiifolia]